MIYIILNLCAQHFAGAQRTLPLVVATRQSRIEKFCFRHLLFYYYHYLCLISTSFLLFHSTRLDYHFFFIAQYSNLIKEIYTIWPQCSNKRECSSKRASRFYHYWCCVCVCFHFSPLLSSTINISGKIMPFGDTQTKIATGNFLCSNLSAVLSAYY